MLYPQYTPNIHQYTTFIGTIYVGLNLPPSNNLPSLKVPLSERFQKALLKEND